MTDTQRRTYSADPDRIAVREVSDESDADGLFRIRMPVTSTAEARDGVAFEEAKVRGFREQIDAERVPVFLDHGRNEATGSHYSALGKVGYLDAPELVDREGATDLDADFVLVDPDELDDGVGAMREALAWVREQAERGIPMASSIGWSEDTGERDLPGDADLLETSIVGIPSDPRTTTASADPAAMARAVSAAADGFDPDQFAATYRAITREDVDEATPVAVDGHAPDTHRRAEYTVDGETVEIAPPEAIQNAAALAMSKAGEGLGEGCGTGTGSRRAQQILDDEVGPDVVDEIAAYLTSHEEDVTADGTPSEWSDEEWDDCGNLQYAKWGGTGTGTGLEWAQDRANAVAEARGEDLPYPNRGVRNIDDPAFGPGDAVMWTWQDEPVHGRVNDVHEEYTPPEADEPITGEDGEAVYSIHEYDEESGELAAEPNVAKPESSLSESTADIPARQTDMTDDSESDSESDADRDEEPDIRAMEEQMAEMREMLDENTRLTREMREMMDGEENENGDEDGEADEDDEEEDDMEENDADDVDETRTVEIDGEERDVDAVADELRDLRSQVDDSDLEADTTDRATDESDGDSDDDTGFGIAGAR